MIQKADLEPHLDWDDIQGNILAGFNKDHQTLLGLKFSADLRKTKEFLTFLKDRLTPLREVVAHKSKRSKLIERYGYVPEDLRAVWTAVAFSFDGLKMLTSESDAFTDAEFRNGLANSSVRLGDPDDSTSPGNVSKWTVGKPGNVPDMLLIVAADNNGELAHSVAVVMRSAGSLGIQKIYEETGHDLSFYSNEPHKYPSGHEHFGFKDGISQPGIRGILPNGKYLTPRLLQQDPTDNGIEYSEAGKPLVCTGQFLLGYTQQLDYIPRQAGPPRPLLPDPNAVAPSWASNGSFLVFRRLKQDVEAFYKFVSSGVSTINRADLRSDRLAAMLVGRWPSGAPIIRTPLRDDPRLADKNVVNAFGFQTDNLGLRLPDDSDGIICPIAAHIRKANPRDGNTDIGQASATLTKRILRRGIPYGPPYNGNNNSDDRGLLFLSYQASIAHQFEFLCSRWMNSSDLPRNPSTHKEGLGFDMLIGQAQFSRVRSAYVRFDGSTVSDVSISNRNLTSRDWVIPTGGGYFFAPSLSAFANVLCI